MDVKYKDEYERIMQEVQIGKIEYKKKKDVDKIAGESP